MRNSVAFVVGLFFPLSVALGLHAASTDPTTLKLLVQADLVYTGAFRVPSGTVGGSTFNFGGGPMVYYPAHNSLFVVGRNNDSTVARGHQIAEIGIPPIVNSATLEGLNVAKVLQPFMEPTEGKFLQAAVRGTPTKIGGLLVSGDRLIGTLYAYYDAAVLQVASHFARPLNLSTPSHVEGPFAMTAPPTGLPRPFATLKAGFFSGYLASVPTVWQPLLGGPAITGQCCIPISARTSNGPGASAFDPDDVGKKNPIPATPLFYYPQIHPLAAWNSANNLYNDTSAIGGVVFPEESRTLLFIGSQGIGAFCYGTAGPGGSCYDPPRPVRGGHAYPYVNQMWAYDANDLAEVKRGKRSPWDVKPYGVWKFDLPFQQSGDEFRIAIAGVAYDRDSGRLFLSQWRGDDVRPVIHVFSIQFCATCSRPSMPAR